MQGTLTRSAAARKLLAMQDWLIRYFNLTGDEVADISDYVRHVFVMPCIPRKPPQRDTAETRNSHSAER